MKTADAEYLPGVRRVLSQCKYFAWASSTHQKEKEKKDSRREGFRHVADSFTLDTWLFSNTPDPPPPYPMMDRSTGDDDIEARGELRDNAHSLGLEAGQSRSQSIAGVRTGLGFDFAFNNPLSSLSFNVAFNNPLSFNIDIDLTDFLAILAGFLRQSATSCCSRACRMYMMAWPSIFTLVGIIWLFVRGPSHF